MCCCWFTLVQNTELLCFLEVWRDLVPWDLARLRFQEEGGGFRQIKVSDMPACSSLWRCLVFLQSYFFIKVFCKIVLKSCLVSISWTQSHVSSLFLEVMCVNVNIIGGISKYDKRTQFEMQIASNGCSCRIFSSAWWLQGNEEEFGCWHLHDPRSETHCCWRLLLQQRAACDVLMQSDSEEDSAVH